MPYLCRLIQLPPRSFTHDRDAQSPLENARSTAFATAASFFRCRFRSVVKPGAFPSILFPAGLEKARRTCGQCLSVESTSGFVEARIEPVGGCGSVRLAKPKLDEATRREDGRREGRTLPAEATRAKSWSWIWKYGLQSPENMICSKALALGLGKSEQVGRTGLTRLRR